MLKTTTAAMLMFATASACASATRDDEPFSPTRSESVMTVSIVAGGTAGIRERCNALGAYSAVGVPGCAVTDTVAKTCTVYVVLPQKMSDQERFAILGHEVLHCFFGRYHSQPVGKEPR